MHINVHIYKFTNPTQEEDVTQDHFFKQSFISLNLEFSFS